MKNVKAFAQTTFVGIATLAVGFSATAAMTSGRSLAIAAPVHRQIITQGPNGASKLVKVNTPQSSAVRQLSPFNLAYMAYQGWFTNEGVPAAGQLLQGYRVGRITATEVAQAAVQTNRLSAETLKDTSYLASLDGQLNTLSQPD